MEIFLDKKAVKQIRVTANDAVEEGDTDTVREDIIQAFNDEQIEEVERRIESGDFYDFISEIIDEWSGDDVDELFELLETHFSEAGIDVKYATSDSEDEEEEAEEEEAEENEDEEELVGIDEEEEEEEVV